jgi:glycosyltransferase involved in cell wall biosynthesis
VTPTRSEPDCAATESWSASEAPELSIVIPCLNEVNTLGICVEKAQRFMMENDVAGEIIVGDNGSTDGSQDLARNLGVRVIDVESRGYGYALQGGIEAARGTYVIMGDADDSYDFYHLEGFVEKLREGYDLVMGNRFKGGIAEGAMPFMHQYLGNPAISLIGRTFFRSRIGDFYCGLRGFRRDTYDRLNIKSGGMEFAIEMVVKSRLLDMKTVEIPTTLSQDGRGRRPHLRTWQDGWRTLKFLLMYSPRWLFLYPGIAFLAIGAVVGAVLFRGPVTVAGVEFDLHTLIFACCFIVLGFSAFSFSLISRVYAYNSGLLPNLSPMLESFQNMRLELGLVVGAVIAFAGVFGAGYSVHLWNLEDFGQMENMDHSLRVVLLSALAMTLGVQIVLTSFLLGILHIRARA